MKELIVLNTADSMEVASKIARALVEGGAAACVNIVPGVRSIYRWQGKLCDDEELLLIIKTTESRFEDVRTKIRALHPYELPEIIAVSIAAGDTEYLRWLSAGE